MDVMECRPTQRGRTSSATDPDDNVDAPRNGEPRKRPAPPSNSSNKRATTAPHSQLARDEIDTGPSCGWVGGGRAVLPVCAGELELHLKQPLRVPWHSLARGKDGDGGASDSEGAVAAEAVIHHNVGVLFARVMTADELRGAERASLGAAAADLLLHSCSKKPTRKKRKKGRAAAADARLRLPPDAVVLATAGAGSHEGRSDDNEEEDALALALLRLQARRQVELQWRVVPTGACTASPLASKGKEATAVEGDIGGGDGGGNRLRVVVAVQLMPAAFVEPHAPPDDHSARNPELSLLLEALFRRHSTRAVSIAAHRGGRRRRGGGAGEFSVHSFYESLRRTAGESPGAAPTPESMTCSLRPYQARAVAWMVSRERPPSERSPSTRLPHPLWSELRLPSATLHANIGIGRLSHRRAWCRETTGTGILAEEMGLGKTVEILALVMSRPCPAHSCVSASTPAELLHRDTSARGVVGSALRPVARLITDLRNHVDAAAFLAPATELFTEQEIPGYRDVVRQPMDLRTVQSLLGSGHYSTPQAVAEDVRLIFRNCWAYNAKTCSVFQCAERLSNLFERRYSAIVARDDDSSAEVGPDERCLRGTLIIAPHSILQQWRDEIARHAPSLAVEVYSGLHSLTSFDEKGYARTEDLSKMKATDDVAAEQQREEKRQARLLDLTKADIVLTTYQALRREVHYASDFTGGGSHVRSLRYAKKYSVPTCPLLSFGWHRVVLDEAQMVESSTAAVAKMARRIRARHRWCVTGTPIGSRGVQDLFGLLVFLRHEPFSRAFWWDKTLMRAVAQSQGMELLRSTMRPIMWRNSKAHVKGELAIPPMTQRLVKLELTTAEREIYNRILTDIRKDAVQGKLTESELMQLRLACAHPQMTRFWASLNAEGQLQVQGGGTSLSMSEILERMITMSQQDMEKHERDLCKHLTHLALCMLKRPAATVTRKASKKRIRFADEDAATAEARCAAISAAPQRDQRAEAGEAASPVRSAPSAHQALLVLGKAVRVADDGLQVLQEGGEKQTLLETSAGALKSWRLVEIALYRVLSEVYEHLEAEPTPQAPYPASICECVVCAKPGKQVAHERCKRRQCALDMIPKKKTDIFEQHNARQAKLERDLAGVRSQIEVLCRDDAIDGAFNRRIRQIAEPFATTDIGTIPGLRGLAGVGGTENPALENALQPEKRSQSAKKHVLTEQLRLLRAQHVIPFTAPLYSLLTKHHLLIRHFRAVLKQLLDVGLHINVMIDGDLARQPGGARALDRARSPTLTAEERRVFLRQERKEAFETGADQRDRSSLADITVYVAPTSASQLQLEALGTEQKGDLESWSQFFTRQARRHQAATAPQDAASPATAHCTPQGLIDDDGRSVLAAMAGRELIARRSTHSVIQTCLAHCQAARELRTLCNASMEEIAAKVSDGRLPRVVGKAVRVVQRFGGCSNAGVAGERLAPGAKVSVLDRAAQGTKMLKYINENLRKDVRQLRGVTPGFPELTGWRRLAKHEQEVYRLNCRLHFLRQVELEDRCVRMLLVAGARRDELREECDRAEACEEYHLCVIVVMVRALD
jgi:hypothetical protein